MTIEPSYLPRITVEICIYILNCKWYFDISELKEAVEDVLPSLVEQGVTVLLMSEHCHTPGIESFSDKVERAADCPVPQSLRSHVTIKSPAVYIYTSGTTGKAGAVQMTVVMP